MPLSYLFATLANTVIFSGLSAASLRTTKPVVQTNSKWDSGFLKLILGVEVFCLCLKVSIAMIKHHDHKQTGEEKANLAYPT